MKTLDAFLIKDILKSFKNCPVAFCIDDVQTYNKALASCRMRCYDLINYLESQGIHAEIYKPFKKYKVVFFMKVHRDKTVKRALKVKSQGSYMIMDPYCEFIDDESRAQDPERINVLKLTELMDVVNPCGQVQYDMFAPYHKNMNIIGDTVRDDYFDIRKQHTDTKQVKLIYCGYGKKCRDTLAIENVIKRLQSEYGVKMLYLTNGDPNISELEYEYELYDQRRVCEQYCMGDIMIAPRPMEGIEHLSHSNTKIAYPMSVGLPVVASPVPSYLDSPAVICRTEEEWYVELKKLISDSEYRKKLGEESRQFMLDNYSMSHIGQIYIDMIKDHLS